MTLPTSPLKALACFKVTLGALLLFMIPQLHAGASNKNGNPYENGTFFQTTGTFSAVVRGENLSGTILFSTGASTNGVSTNSSGSSVIVFQGNTYMGNSAGMWNPSSGTITGQIWGGQSLSGSNGTTIYPEIFNTNNYPVPINVVSNVVIPPTSGTVSAGGVVIPGSPGTNYSVTNTIYVEPVGTNVVQDGVYMNGSFDGNVQNNYPNQTFTASGSLIQQQLAQTPIMGTNAALNGGYSNGGPPTANNVEGTTPVQVSSINIPITVQGLRVADTFTSFNTVNNSSNVPYSATYYTVTNVPGQSGGL